MAIIKPLKPVRAAIEEVLDRIGKGKTVDRRVERQCLDLKEEAGRRDHKGQVLPGSTQNERAAVQLAQESACMANTPGGGGLLVGIADDGTLIGTQLDPEWLRRRIYELTDRKLTAEVQPVIVRGKRFLTIISPAALEPIRWKGKIFWRVGDSCAETDLSTWHDQQRFSIGYDETAQATHLTSSDVRAGALEFVRGTLKASGDEKSRSLLEASDLQLLRRLGAVTHESSLTQAAALFFVGREQPTLDYIYRDYPGGDSLTRVHQTGISMAEELKEVLLHLSARNPVQHIHGAPGIGQTRAIGELAAREAIINGLAHRDWNSLQPTVVEHIGTTLRVLSPGGFYGTVNEHNILTHPSSSRNRALTQLLAAVKLAEQEGIGVDRMVAQMICVGHSTPEIVEIEGPMVRTTLVGGPVHESWIRWLGSLTPESTARDVNALLVLRHLIQTRWIDANVAAPILQLGRLEAQETLQRLQQVQLDQNPILQRIRGIPSQAKPAWAFHPAILDTVEALYASLEPDRLQPSRKDIAESYAKARGRISSAELASMTGASPSNLGHILKALEREGLLAKSNPSGRGQGFHYLWVDGIEF